MDVAVSLSSVPLLLLAAGASGGLHAAIYAILALALTCWRPSLEALPAVAALALAFLIVQGICLAVPAAGAAMASGPLALWLGPTVLVLVGLGRVALARQGGWAVCLTEPAVADAIGVDRVARARVLLAVATVLVIIVALLRPALPSALSLPAVPLVPLALALALPAPAAVVVASLAFAGDAAAGFVAPDIPSGLIGAVLALTVVLAGSTVRALRIGPS